MMRYDIYFENKAVGIACVESTGLYTLFRCRCKFRKEGSYRITAEYGMLRIDLGLCFPEENMFVTNARVATKKLNTETPRFFAYDVKRNDMKFIPVDPQTNFTYIGKLAEAKFHVNENIRGILIDNDHHGSPCVISSK